MPAKIKIYRKQKKSDTIDRSILIALFLILLLIISVDLVSRNFHVLQPDNLSRVNNPEHVQNP